MVNNGENRMSYLPFWSILGMVYIPFIQMANLGMIVCYWVYHININVESKLILTNDTGVLWLTIKPILDRWVTPLWSSTFCTSPSLWLGCRSWDPWDSDWWLSSVFKSVLKKKKRWSPMAGDHAPQKPLFIKGENFQTVNDYIYIYVCMYVHCFMCIYIYA